MSRLIEKVKACIEDPMWADHCEVSKSTMQQIFEALESKQPAAAPSAPAVPVQFNALEAGGLGAAVMHVIYRACQRGDSPERMQAAVMSAIALAAPSPAQAQPVADGGKYDPDNSEDTTYTN
jgi:hypothetical protein